MSTTWSFRALPPGVREEAKARAKIIREVLTIFRKEVMPRHRPMDIDVWERTLATRIPALIADAQLRNAELVDLTMGMSLVANGWQDTPIGLIDPAGFAGRMPDGDPLEIVPRAVAKHVRERLALFEEPTPEQKRQAWESGGKLLATITQTALIDTQRMAKAVAGMMRPRTLYVRVAQLPCCARCAVLSGKRGYWEKPFQRHPGCDCTQIPVPEGKAGMYERPTSAQEYFDSLSAEEQDRVFTKAGAAAIRAGADINQVVNSRSGMSAAGSAFTTVGTTARSKTMRYYYGKPTGSVRGMARVPRLSVPEIIARTQGDARARTGLLFQHGYIRSVQPGVLPGEVFDLVADQARVRQQALFEEFVGIVPLIDPALPVEHITNVTSKRFLYGERITVGGGHSYSCMSEVLTYVQQCQAKNHNAQLSTRKTFFPRQDDEQLVGWLETVKRDAYNAPDWVDKSRQDGWIVQKLVTGNQGNRMLLELLVGPAGKNSNYRLKTNSVYPKGGDNVFCVEVDGRLVKTGWEG